MGLDPNEGDSVEDDPVGSTLDGPAADTGTVSEVADDAEDNAGAAGVFKDAGGGKVEDSGIDESSGLAAGADAGIGTWISEDGN